ncbi:hypothetical protein [Tenacibaculum sp. UWU-22]|uniref:hypothetical protein n=1 Tax=Tenacibaculum sp. UWU-22 TaxID=3234187 RepID=UPI0034DAFB8F
MHIISLFLFLFSQLIVFGQELSTLTIVVSDVQIDPNGDILVIGKDGEVVELPGGEDTVITDSNGQVWTVDEQGNVGDQALQAEGGASTPDNTNGVNTNGQATAISAKGVVVTFTKASDSKYGFDSYQSNYSATKELYKKLGNDYYIPYKAVAKNDTETIVANLSITGSSIKPQDVLFKTKEGVAITKIDSTATSYTLQLKGVFDDAEIETQALVKQGTQYEVAGAFIQYQAVVKNVKVTLVNTTNTDTEAIKKELQNIYKQAMVNITITEINDFKYDLEALTPNGIIESGESGYAAQYTEQQRQINNKLKQHPVYKEDTYYLIITDKQPSSSNEKGLMPLGRQFGYIYTTNCTTANCIPLTVAHELGHGAFQLKHPFSKYSYQYAQKATNWLLDYKEGTKLPFVHWQAIHNPKLRIGVFDKDGEGESNGDDRHEDLINYDVLVNWIKDNYGKSSVPYDVQNFIVPSKLEYFWKLDKVKQLAYSVPFEYNGRKLELKGSLSREKGNVNLSKIYMLLELEINKKHSYTDKIKYVTNENHKEEDAIRITIEDVKDYEEYSAYTGISFNKKYVLEKYNKEFEIAGNDCNKLDFLYEHAPSFIIDKRKDFYWKDLKILTSCSLNEWGTDEEKAVIKLVNGIGKNNAKDLLDGLLTNKLDDKTLFRIIYDKIDNYGGEDNFTKYIKTLYKYWLQTDYAKQDVELYIPYNSKKVLGFYTDDFATFFHTKNNEIHITSRYNNPNRHYEYLGHFDFYKKVNLLNSNQEGEGVKIPAEEIPVFYLKAFKDINSTANLETGFSLTLDVVTTFTGVGNIAKLRHLRHLTKLQKGLKYTIAGAEITSGALNAMLTVSDCESEFCEKLRVHLFWLEMGSLGLDVFTQKMIKKTAKEALEKADNTVDDLIIDELTKVAEVTVGLVKYPKVRKALDEVSVILKSKGIDRIQVERVLKQSDNLKYLEENSELIVEISNEIGKGHFTDGDLLKIFRKVVNTDFVRDLLPNSFVSVLKKFGKTEDEIVSYFKNYHNIHTKGDFFEIIEEVLRNGNNYNLTRDETYAIWGYTTNFFTEI